MKEAWRRRDFEECFPQDILWRVKRETDSRGKELIGTWISYKSPMGCRHKLAYIRKVSMLVAVAMAKGKTMNHSPVQELNAHLALGQRTLYSLERL